MDFQTETPDGRLFFQDNAESGSFARSDWRTKSWPLWYCSMIRLDRLRPRPQPRFLGRKAGFEDLLEISRGNTFASVGNIHEDLFFLFLDA